MSAYFQFLNDIRNRLVKENPNVSVAEISKLAGYIIIIIQRSAEWREVDPKTKSKFQKKAEVAREEYEVEKAEFENKHGSIKKARKRKNAEKVFEKKRTQRL